MTWPAGSTAAPRSDERRRSRRSGGAPARSSPTARRAATGSSRRSTPPGPEPRAGQFYMLAAADGWGSAHGRPYLPRAFSVAEAEARRRRRPARLPGRGGRPGDRAARRASPGRAAVGHRAARPAVLGARASSLRMPPGRSWSAAGIGIAPLAILRRELADRGVPSATLLGFRDRAPLGRGRRALRVLRGPDGERGRPHRPQRLRDRPARGAARGRRRRERRPSTPAGRPAMLEAVRAICAEREVDGRAGHGDADGLRLRRLLRLRGAARRRRLHAPVRGRPGGQRRARSRPPWCRGSGH